jgi:hypothetical protein
MYGYVPPLGTAAGAHVGSNPLQFRPSRHGGPASSPVTGLRNQFPSTAYILAAKLLLHAACMHGAHSGFSLTKVCSVPVGDAWTFGLCYAIIPCAMQRLRVIHKTHSYLDLTYLQSLVDHSCKHLGGGGR